MAEVTRVLREMQLGNDGGLVPASGSVPPCSMRRTKLAKDDSAAVGEIGFGKAERKAAVAANKEATGTGMTKAASWSDFRTCRTNLAGNKPAAKAEGKLEPALKAEAKREAAAKAEGKREAAAKAEGKREAAAKAEGKREAVAIGDGKLVTAAKEEGKVALVTERVPDSYIQRLRNRRTPRPRPITEPFILSRPKLLKQLETFHVKINCLVDMEENVLRQADANGYAELVVDYSEGVKKLYPLPGY